MTYIAQTHRARTLDFLPKSLKMVEIGVFEGDYSAHLLKRADPSSLTLIDPWLQHDDAAYARDTANSKTSVQNARYEKVKNRFKAECKSGQVKIVRDLSVPALANLTGEMFDFAYVDAMHYEDAVLDDLNAISRCMHPDGLISGHDFAAHPLARRKNFGVIQAVRRFCEATAYVPIVITNERWASYYLAREGSPVASAFLTGLLASDIPLSSFPARLIGTVRQRSVSLRGEEKIITEVC